MNLIDHVAEFESGPWAAVFEAARTDLEFVSRVLQRREQAGETVLPQDKGLAFEPFRLISPDRVKVVLIGKDPTPSGLAFSVPRHMPTSSAVTAVHRELAHTIPGFEVPTHGDLSAWSRQGVLFLTCSLTARDVERRMSSRDTADKAGHGALWYPFLSHVLAAVLAANPHVVFVSWGSRVRDLFSALSLGDINRLEACEPGAPAFAGCDHFDKINRHLANCERAAVKKHGDAGRSFLVSPIDWSL